VFPVSPSSPRLQRRTVAAPSRATIRTEDLMSSASTTNQQAEQRSRYIVTRIASPTPTPTQSPTEMAPRHYASLEAVSHPSIGPGATIPSEEKPPACLVLLAPPYTRCPAAATDRCMPGMPAARNEESTFPTHRGVPRMHYNRRQERGARHQPALQAMERHIAVMHSPQLDPRGGLRGSHAAAHTP